MASVLGVFTLKLTNAELHAVCAGTRFRAARESVAGGRELEVNFGNSGREAGIVPDVRVICGIYAK